MLRIGVIGELDRANETHMATDAALVHSSAAVGVAAMARWVSTDEVAREGPAALELFHGLLIAPGSPYSSEQGALDAISWGRRHGVPVLGTCGGFQHIVLELARGVLGYADAEHAEHHPEGKRLFLVPVACSVRGQSLPVQLVPGTKAAAAYGTASATESYYCSFELNPAYVDELVGSGMVVSGTGPEGETRVIELAQHPFFLGTLFVPQVSSTLDRPHPVVNAFLSAASARRAGAA